MTKVKICGLQEQAHVKTAIHAGADAIGFVFAPSKRRVSIEQAQQLAKHVPQGVLKIGVFVNPTPAELKEAVERVPLDYVQYHGRKRQHLFRSKAILPSRHCRYEDKRMFKRLLTIR